MGSIPITRSIPRQRQASRGHSGGVKILIAWENWWELRTDSAPDRCPRLPLVAPAFARGVALGFRLILQVRIRGRDFHLSTRQSTDDLSPTTWNFRSRPQCRALHDGQLPPFRSAWEPPECS